MLIMAEVSSEMGAELRESALAQNISVAAEVGRRLERLARVEATETTRLELKRSPYKDWDDPTVRRRESLYSGPWDMFRNTGNGRYRPNHTMSHKALEVGARAICKRATGSEERWAEYMEHAVALASIHTPAEPKSKSELWAAFEDLRRRHGR